MAIWIKVFGGRKVKRVIERTLSTPADARAYLGEWGISGPTKNVTGKHFAYNANDFTLSHSIEDIFKHDHLEDNDMSKTKKTTQTHMDATGRNTGNKPMPATDAPHQSDKHPNPQQVSKKPSSNEKLVCLKEICRDIDMDPRVARQKLRKLNPGNGKQRWEWPTSEVEGIKQKLGGK